MNPSLQLRAAELRERDVFGEVPTDNAPAVAPCKTIPITPQVLAHDAGRSHASQQTPTRAVAIAPEPVSTPAMAATEEERDLDVAWSSLSLGDKRFVLQDALRRSR